MKYNIIDEGIPYTINLAEGLMVTHSEAVRISKETGRELYGFIHVVQGWIEYRFPDERPALPIHAGQTVFVPKGCRYVCIYPPEPATVAIFQFDLQSNRSQLPPQDVILLSSDAQRQFRGFTDQYAQLNPLICAARIYDLLDILLQEPPGIPKKYRRLLPAIEQLEQAPASNFDVSYYAQLCGMSVPGFRRSFKEYLGFSPIEYRNSLRLINAKKLIMSGEFSVEEAANQSGFTNLSFFYRLFRRKFGTRPGSL